MNTQLLARAANVSVATIDDLIKSVALAWPTWAVLDISPKDMVTALAILANHNIVEDSEPAISAQATRTIGAGIQLKAMLTHMQSRAASKELLHLGIMLFSNNHFVGLREMIANLADRLTGVSTEQRYLSIQKIAGNLGMGALLVLINEDVRGFDAMTKSIDL